MPERVIRLKLEMSPTWEHLEDVRHFIEAFCLRGALSEGRAQAVAMTVHELLQNAVQNSTDPASVVSLELDGAADEVRVVVENRAAPAHHLRLAALREVLERHEDDEALFLHLMRGSAEKSGSGLGLGRIRYEGQMRLEIELKGELVRISARGAARDLGA